MLKIAFIVSKFPSLSETFILEQLIGLISSGVHVDVYAEMNPREKKIHESIIKMGLLDKVTYFKPLTTLKKLAILSRIISTNLLLNFKRTSAFLLHLLQLSSSNIRMTVKNQVDIIWENCKAFYLLNTKISRKKYDVIHCHFGPNGIIGAGLIELGIKSKLVTTFYGFDLSSYLKNKPYAVYSNLFKIGDLFFPICKFFEQILQSQGCNKNKLIVHPVGVDLEYYNKQPRMNENDAVTIISIGRLIEKKGMHYAIKAMVSIIPQFPDIKLIILGDGPLKEYLNQLVVKLKLTNNVQLPGSVERAEMYEYMAKSDIFILHSVKSRDGETEGTPKVLLEAQAMMLPVISTFHAGIPEIVEDGVTGILVPEGSIERTSLALKSLVIDREKRKQMGILGRERVESHFDNKILNQKLIEYYKNLVS